MKGRSLRLQTRMTLWFTLSVAGILTVLFGLVYGSLEAILASRQRDELRLAVTQLSSQVEYEKGLIHFENETPISEEIVYFLTEENGSELASRGDIGLFDMVPVKEDGFTRTKLEGERWLVLDSPLLIVGEEAVRVPGRRAMAAQRAGAGLHPHHFSAGRTPDDAAGGAAGPLDGQTFPAAHSWHHCLCQ